MSVFRVRGRFGQAVVCGAVQVLVMLSFSLMGCRERAVVFGRARSGVVRCATVAFASSCSGMVLSSRVFVLLVAGQAFGQSAWQAGEPISVNIDYDVPAVGVEDGAALVQRNFGLEAKLTAAAPAQAMTHANGFSAAALHSGQRLRGDAVPPGEAEVVVHVPGPGFSFAEEAALLAEVNQQFGLLKGLVGQQRSQEARALSVAGGLAERVAGIAGRGRLRKGRAVNEPVAEAEVASSYVSGSGRQLGEFVAEVGAGGYVARRALEELVSLASDPGARSAIAASGAARTAATLLQRTGTDETNRALAGSLLTLLSGMPLAAEVSSEITGSGGQVEVVLPRPSRVYGPDAVAMQLSSGVFPSHVQA